MASAEQIDELLVDLFLDMHETLPERIVLDVDATDDRLHGQQEGRFYHGYYRHYCYLPRYITCGDRGRQPDGDRARPSRSRHQHQVVPRW